MTKKIVITGAGVVSAIGIGKEETLSALLAGKTGIGEVKYLETIHKELPVGEVKLSNEELTRLVGVPSDGDEPQSRNALLGRLALREALKEAGFVSTDNHFAKVDEKAIEKMAFISGTTVAGMDRAEVSFVNADHDAMTKVLLESRSDCRSNTEDIARAFGKFAFIDTISTACSSAANALEFGANLIKTGQFDVVVAGGSESLSRLHFNGFNTLMILDKEQCRPFDETRAGLNLGEGAAYLVLESEEHATAREAKTLAVLSGYANTCDAFHQTASSAEGDGAFLAMSKAIEMAGLQPDDVDYINSHGTGTPNNDPSELRAMHRVFGEKLPAYSSTKSFTGHTTSASGSIEAVFCILALKHQFLPVSLNCKTAIEGEPSPVKSGDKPQCEIRNILCNAFGFGGNDSAMVFSKQEKGERSTEMSSLSLSSFPSKKVFVLAHDILSPEDPNFKEYMSMGDARRLGRLLKRTLAASKITLSKGRMLGNGTNDEAQPDAIITGTKWGNVESSELFLRDMINFGEETLSPTHFMQATQNTLGSLIAINTKNHGYNCTHSNGDESLETALKDAYTQMQLGQIRTALVGRLDCVPKMVNETILLATEDAIPDGVIPIDILKF